MAAVGTNFYVLEAEIWTYHLHLLTLIHYYEVHPGAMQKLQVFLKELEHTLTTFLAWKQINNILMLAATPPRGLRGTWGGRVDEFEY